MDVTWGHFHAVLLKNCHKYMKAPVTTHDLLLLAESKLSCTNVRNSDQRTQITGICCCYYHEDKPRGNLSKPFGCSSFEFSLTDKSSLYFHYSNGEGWREGWGKREKEKKQRRNINAIEPNHSYSGRLSLSKGTLKAIFIPRRSYISEFSTAVCFNFYFFKYEAET